MRVGFDLSYTIREEVNQGIGNYSFYHIAHMAQRPEIEAFRFQPVSRNYSRTDYVQQVSQFIQDSQLDAFYLPSPMTAPFLDAFFTGEIPAVRVMATVYDIIPLRLPDIYLPTQDLRRSYEQRIEILKNLHHLFAISAFTRQDLIQAGFDGDAITAVGTGSYETFYPMENASLADFQKVFAIDAPFVLATNAYDFRKNTERLIQAFSIASAGLAEPWQLVLVNYLTPQRIAQLKSTAKQYGIENRVKYAGRITKSQLLRLYNRAGALAFPTLYEGLGLPAIEAMQCGTPVVASNRASLPEVVGDAGILVDPENVDNIAHGLRRVMSSPALRAQLRKRGLARTESLDWGRVAELSVSGLARAMEAPFVSLPEKLPLPKPTAASGLTSAQRPAPGSSLTLELRPNRYHRVRALKNRSVFGAYVSFNLAELPAGVTIQKAVMHIPVQRPPRLRRPQRVQVRRIRNGWDVISIRRRRPLLRTVPVYQVNLKPRSTNQVVVWPCTNLAKNWQRFQLKNHGVHIRPAAGEPRLLVTISG